MTQHASGAAASCGAGDAWSDSADYPHRIENHVKVYLHVEGASVLGRVGGRWAVSGVTVDGSPLDGTENGNYCDYEGHPVGARPDWDRQHEEADALDLPTAEELLPLLAEALGTSVEGPTASQVRAAADLLAEHAAWRSERADLSAGESVGDFPTAADWQASDDVGCDLADRAVALLGEITGQHTAASEPSVPAEDPLTMQVAVEAVGSAESRLRRRPDPPRMGEGRAPAGPAR